MIDVCKWLFAQREHRLVDLFAVDADGVVSTKERGTPPRRILCRSRQMEQTIIEIVETGLSQPDFEGLLYVMGFGSSENFRPAYVGKAERKGVKRPLSANLVNLSFDQGKFARWGDGLDYHIGDLSHALFEWPARRTPRNKYRRWADALFARADPPQLREPVKLYLLPWRTATRGPSGLLGSLAAGEKEAIALAGAQYGSTLLNTDGW
jgi:hypothetical protein